MDAIKKGQRYRHPKLRGTWTVQSAGSKFVTLKANIPWLKSQRIPTEEFKKAGWSQV